MSEKTLKAQFETADNARSADKARLQECALYTDPKMLPGDVSGPNGEIIRSFEDIGRRGLANLVSRMSVALFSPGLPWFAFAPTPRMQVELDAESFDAWDGFLYARELQVQSRLEQTSYRVAMRPTIKSILGVGSGLVHMDTDFTFRTYRWDQYVQKRRHSGEWQWLITKVELLPEEITDDMAAKSGLEQARIKAASDANRTFSVFTRCDRQADGTFVVRIELNGKDIDQFAEKTSPFLLVGFDEIPGEDYPQGFADEHLPSLRSANALKKGILEGVAMATKYNPVVDTTKGVDAKDVAKPNGVVITGRVNGGVVDGIGFAQTQKHADLRVAQEELQSIKQDLGKAFLLESAAQRQAERVTAVEVARVGRELEDALGAPYVQIADELQKPMIERTIDLMQRNGDLLPLPDSIQAGAETKILTGLEALGRQRTLEKLGYAIERIVQVPGAADRIRWAQVYEDVFRGTSLDPNKYIKTDEEVAAEQQAAMDQQIAAAGAQQLMQTAGKVTEKAAPAAA